MTKLGVGLRTWVKPSGIFASAFVLAVGTFALPARAQDIFGVSKFLSPAVAAVPVRPFESRTIERPKRRAQSHPKPVPIEQISVKTTEKLKAPGEIDNPFPALMTDSTLRPGDMVMFPDGLRVFTGQPGNQHKLAAFKPIAQAGKAVPTDTRKLVANLRPSVNSAWTTDGFRSGDKFAVNTIDVETTGSTASKAKRGGSRSLR